MRNSMIRTIEASFSTLTKSQRMVANYIINNPMKAAFSTIDQIAHEVGVSTATIIRLCESLNYLKYSEFQKELQNTLSEQADPSTKLELSSHTGGMENNVLIDIIKRQSENIALTCEGLSGEKVQEAEALLSNTNRIYLCGSRSCYSVAHYLYYDLFRIYGHCELLDDEGGTLPERLSEIGQGDVILSITLPRYIKSVVTTTEFAKRAGAFVIAISDSYMSPLADLADVFFAANCKSTGFHNALTPVMLIADILISYCTACNMQKTRRNLDRVREITLALDTHIND